ncbi:single-stranded DNA-binding protein [Eikenella sp. S3360]|uniref:Single-stranded DNA-binding protein n=1 Tax=Eikenella glucosivorans TaxID=2766967 RepID=A0ABS0NAE3_9NEIS|nr:single-stranded DNA-binding protein [Eikenella glucosivorans]MBH5329251.1 single-stranded DNA-binding protein [Eikenella glucosivorans]
MSISIIVRGNLGQSFELKEINRSDGETSTVLNFSIASNRFKRQKVDGQDRYVAAGPTEWLECEYWNRRATHLHNLLAKGMPVVVEGEELSETYEKDGQTIKTRKIRVENIYLNLNSERIASITLNPSRTSDQAAAADDNNNPL